MCEWVVTQSCTWNAKLHYLCRVPLWPLHLIKSWKSCFLPLSLVLRPCRVAATNLTFLNFRALLEHHHPSKRVLRRSKETCFWRCPLENGCDLRYGIRGELNSIKDLSSHTQYTYYTHTHTVVDRVSIVKFIVENNVEYVLIFDNEFNNESKKHLQSFWKKNVENHY